MKNMRKLIPAIAMLLVSAVMMSTASFAWFSMADQAVATGMKVNAVAAGGLVIGSYTSATDEPSEAAFGSNVSAAWNNHNDTANAIDLDPTSLAIVSNAAKWFNGTGNQEAGSAYDANTEYAEVTGNNYYLLTKWQVKALATDTSKDLAVKSVRISNDTHATTDALNKSIRVALKVTYGTTTNWYFFAPTATPATGESTLPFISAVDAAGDKTVGNRTIENGTNSATLGVDDYADRVVTGNGTTVGVRICDDFKDTVPVEVEVYVYYEGEDPNCVSAYASTTNKDTTISIDFTTIPHVTVTP